MFLHHPQITTLILKRNFSVVKTRAIIQICIKNRQMLPYYNVRFLGQYHQRLIRGQKSPRFPLFSPAEALQSNKKFVTHESFGVRRLKAKVIEKVSLEPVLITLEDIGTKATSATCFLKIFFSFPYFKKKLLCGKNPRHHSNLHQKSTDASLL